MKRFSIVATFLLALPTLSGAEKSSKETYAPGLGEFMTMTQMRHAKLWFAGKAENWDLARFELEEIEEGLEDAAKLHPTHDGMAVAEMIKANTEAPLKEIAKSVDAKDTASFTSAFDKLTAGCNACHVGTQHAYIRIDRPTLPPLSNQVF